MDLCEGTRRRCAHVGVQDDSHQATRGARGGLVRRGESIVHDVHIRAVGRDGRSRVVAAVAGGLDRTRARPGGAAVGRLSEVHMRRGERPTDVGHDDPVRRVRAGGSAVGNVDARRRAEIAACSRDPVNHRTAEHRVDDAWLRDRTSDILRPAPVRAAVGRARHELERLVPRGRGRADTEDVGDARAVSADRAAVEGVALAVVRGCRDLVLRPRLATVMGNSDDERRRSSVPLFLTAERGPA